MTNNRTSDTASGGRGRRTLHPWRIVVFTVVMILILMASFAAGSLVRRPESTALENRDIAVPVTARAELREVQEVLALKGSVVSGTTVPLPALSASAPDATVVTDIAVGPGDSLSPGSYIGSIAGRPQIVIGDDVPLYRDLKLNDTGADVARLQKSLRRMGYQGIPTTGKIEAVTLEAVRLIYAKAGLETPGKTKDDTTFRWLDFVQIPGDSGRVIRASTVASRVSGDAPLVLVQTSPNTITARALILQADRLPPGTPVKLKWPGGESSSIVEAVSKLLPADSGATKPAGKDVTIKLSDQASGLPPGQDVDISLPTVGKAVLAIPLISIQHDAGGAFVEVLPGADGLSSASTSPPVPRKVKITVKTQAAGWAEIEADPSLPAGTEIRVP
ncbi:hypothetical protein SPF06_02170 [Sinomonas sp. JGH33]|uniref:Peptidoglycan binding-like domain-containing protein n=1 Tax=Sinomonas terricola TaxID=3110330 RepID=A0ABU5T1I9_9MICC|nr:hypothetical protein [Sinomonas sp. JGH33]MEA5453519.1 hypothetical protein [Sinomonas sp. JGH33]